MRHGVYMLFNIESGLVMEMVGRNLVGTSHGWGSVVVGVAAHRVRRSAGGRPSDARSQKVNLATCVHVDGVDVV